MWHRKTRVHLATQQSPLQKNRLLIEKVNKENKHIQIKTDFFLHPKSIEKNLLAVKPQNVPHSFLRSLLDDEVDVGDRVVGDGDDEGDGVVAQQQKDAVGGDLLGDNCSAVEKKSRPRAVVVVEDVVGGCARSKGRVPAGGMKTLLEAEDDLGRGALLAPEAKKRTVAASEVVEREEKSDELPATGNQCYGRWWMRAYRGTRRTLEKKREGEQSFFSLSEKLRRNDVSGKQWNYPQANSELTGYAVAYSKMYGHGPFWKPILPKRMFANSMWGRNVTVVRSNSPKGAAGAGGAKLNSPTGKGNGVGQIKSVR